MKTLYIECNMGAAGDMIQGALVDLIDCQDEFTSKMNSLGLKNVAVECNTIVKSGIVGEKVDVLINGIEESEHIENHHHHHEHEDEHHHHEHNHTHDHQENHHHDHHHHHHHHEHNSLEHIINIIDGLDVSEKVRKDAKAIFTIIADAESQVHGKSIDNIHFHEVGSIDAVCDVVGCALLMEMIDADKIASSNINTGRGFVKCAHGILPVPAPATALILKDVPCYSNEIEGELITPTGAAIIKYYAEEYSRGINMTYSKIGYGFGTKTFAAVNCVRAFLCEEADELTDIIVKLEANLDDITAEDIGFVQNLLLDSGALDVFTTPAAMKKSRPGNILTCLCKENLKEKMVQLIFAHTSTIGIRESVQKRYIMNRKLEVVKTTLGDVQIKTSEGYGTRRYKIEHDCLEKIAIDKGLALEEARKLIEAEIGGR